MRPLVLAAVSLCTACQCGPQGLSPVADNLVVDPDALDFGEVDVGQTRTLEVTVMNQGLATATVHPFVAAGPFSAPLADLTLAAGASRALSLTFAPTQAGTFNANLSLGSSLGVDLTGRAQGGATSCISQSCADLHVMCGITDDGCGKPLDCGGCLNGMTCDPELSVCSCPGSGVEICGNGKDDDCDGLADCADSDCASTPACATATCDGGGVEVCGNGTDDDCDGLIDCADSDCATTPACAAVTCESGTELRLTAGPRSSAGADIAWSGTEFGVAWMYDGSSTSPSGLDFGFERVDATGAPVGGPVDATTDGLMAHPPRITWSGTDWAIGSATLSADHSQNLIQVRRLSSAGVPNPTVLTLGQGWPATVAADPTTGELGVLWGVTAMGNQPALTLVSSAQSVGADNVITTGGNWNDYGDLVWSGSGWGAVWTEDVNGVPGVYFSTLDATGTPVGTPLQMDTGAGGYVPRVAWSGTHYGAVYAQGNDVFFRRYSATGQGVGAAVQLTSLGGGAPDITWTGSAFAVVWEDTRTLQHTIWLTELDDAGQSVGQPRQVSCGTGGSSRPGITSSGTQLGVVWHDLRNTPLIDVYFKLVAP